MPPEQTQFTGEGDSSGIRSRGFTLIELLVVIAIIGLLSSVVLASLNTARAKANDAKRLADMRTIQTGLELYASDHNGLYPIASNSTWASQCQAWGSFPANSVIPGLVPTYLPSFPSDPQMNQPSVNYCCYVYNSDGNNYKILAHNCPSSSACYGAGEATGGMADPVRPTWSCALYTSGAANW
jgi:prepilin-type N-terminal cleavage/methylation domain-containing protein